MDGRRSAQWRVWTGSRNTRPSNDVYIAPRSLGGESKVSLHRDGSCFYKLTEVANPRARLGDRQAFHRWAIEELMPGTTVRRGLRIRFPEDELVSQEGDNPGVAVVKAPPAGSVLMVLILVSDSPVNWTTLDLEVLAVLERASGGQVAVVCVSQKWNSAAFAEQVQRVSSGIGWAVPVTRTEDKFGWLFSGSESLYEFTEFSSAQHQISTEPVPLPPFAGRVEWLPDSDLPEGIRSRDDICGVVRLTRSGVSTLYVDRRARCDHSRLGVNAEEIRRSWVTDRSDGAYEVLPDGSRVSMLATLGLYEDGVRTGKISAAHRMGQAGFFRRRWLISSLFRR